jgi:hypothetical protein
MTSLLVRLGLLTTITAAGCAIGSTATSDDPLSAPPTRPSPTGTSTTTSPDPASDAGLDAPTSNDAATTSDAPVDSAPPGACIFTGALVSFDLSKLSGVQADLAASTKAPGLTATTLTRFGVTATSSSQAMNASDWPTGAIDTGKYFVFSVTAPAGCALAISALTVDLKSSATGPTSASVGTSVDGYASLAGVAVTTAGGSANVPLAGLAKVTGSVEIHVFGFNAASSAGTMRVEGTLSLVGGTVTP